MKEFHCSSLGRTPLVEKRCSKSLQLKKEFPLQKVVKQVSWASEDFFRGGQYRIFQAVTTRNLENNIFLLKR